MSVFGFIVVSLTTRTHTHTYLTIEHGVFGDNSWVNITQQAASLRSPVSIVVDSFAVVYTIPSQELRDLLVSAGSGSQLYRAAQALNAHLTTVNQWHQDDVIPAMVRKTKEWGDFKRKMVSSVVEAKAQTRAVNKRTGSGNVS